MKTKKILILLATAVVTTGLLAGCGSSTKNETSSNNTQTEQNSTNEQKNDTTKNEETALKDGKYKAEASDFDEHGWKPFVEIEVSGGKITAVTYDYISKEGKLKTEDAEYNKSMEEKTKTSPVKYTKELEDSLIEKQDVAAVDTVTGATHSSDNFKKLATKAIENAEAGNTEVGTVEIPAE